MKDVIPQKLAEEYQPVLDELNASRQKVKDLLQQSLAVGNSYKEEILKRLGVEIGDKVEVVRKNRFSGKNETFQGFVYQLLFFNDPNTYVVRTGTTLDDRLQSAFFVTYFGVTSKGKPSKRYDERLNTKLSEIVSINKIN